MSLYLVCGIFATYFECTQGGLGRRPVITFFQFR